VIGGGNDLRGQSHRSKVFHGGGFELCLAGLEIGSEAVDAQLLLREFPEGGTAQRVLAPPVDEGTPL